MKKTKKGSVKKSEEIDLFNEPKEIKVIKQYNLLKPDTVDIFVDGVEVAQSKPLDIKKEEIENIINELPNDGRLNIKYSNILLNCPNKKYFKKLTNVMFTTYENEIKDNTKDLIDAIEKNFKLIKKDKYEFELINTVDLGLTNPR